MDNPIFVKHLHNRFHPRQFYPLLAIVLVLAVLITWYGLAVAHPADNKDALLEAWRTAAILLIFLQGCLLIIGSSQIATAVAQARKSGILDVQHISTQSPEKLAMVFLLDAPLREFLLFICTLPCTLVLALSQPAHAVGLSLVMVELVVFTLFCNTIALLIGLAIKSGQPGIIALVVFLALNLFWYVPLLGHLSIINTLHIALVGPLTDLPFQSRFFGLRLHPFLLALLHQLPFAGFNWLAAVRMMRQDQAKPLSKVTEVILYLVVAVLALGDTTIFAVDRDSLIANPGATLYILLGTAILLSMLTPTLEQMEKGYLLAGKSGQSRVSRWSDAAPNGLLVLTLALLLGVFAAAAFGLCSIWNLPVDPGQLIIAALIALCTILYFGLALQYALFTNPKDGLTYFAGILFLLWIVVPALLAMRLGRGHDAYIMMKCLGSISPLAGIGLSFDEQFGILYGSISLVISAVLAGVLAVLYRRCVQRVTKSLEAAANHAKRRKR